MKKHNKSKGLALLAVCAMSSLGSIGAYAADNNPMNSLDTNMMSDLSTNSMSGTNVDNSRQNRRDRNGETRTPLEQGRSREDMQLTREIRKSVVNETNHFSVMARNVKIITRDGKVTLHGPVNTEMEKKGICDIAKQAAGAANVNDLLEVKSNSQNNTSTNSLNQN